MKLSQGKDGIPLVKSTVQRDALFPTPAVDQRVQNLETGLIERYTGTDWLGVNTQGGAVYDAVRDFGVPANGVDDAAAAINSALTAMTSGGTLQFPRGTYKVTGQIAIAHDGTTMQFAPGATVAATIASADVTLILASGKDSVTVEGLNVDGAFPWAVYISGGSGHRVRRCRIRGGTVAQSGKCGGIYIEDCSDVRITENDIASCGNASLDAGADILVNLGDIIASDITIADNECHSTLTTQNICCFNLFNGQILTNRVSGARVFASTPTAGGYGILCYKTMGIDPEDVGEVLIHGNRALDTQGNGIYTQDGIRRVTITDNHVRGACTTMTTGGGLLVAGIVCEGEDSIVANNRVMDSGHHGIATSTHAGIQIVNNRIISPLFDGITTANNTDLLIKGNFISGILTDRLAIGHAGFVDQVGDTIVIEDNVMIDVSHAIMLGVSAVNCIARHNTATGLTDTGYIAQLRGTGCIVEGNIGNGISFPEGASADRGNADQTLVHGQDFETQRFATTLTANRTITLSSTNARNGAKFRVVRTGLGSFTLDVGGLKTIPSATAAVVDVMHDGTAWRLIGYQTL